MSKKDFTKTAKQGIDNLIKPTADTVNIETETYAKTSLEVPEALYLEFKGNYLIPKKITLKEFVKEAMEIALAELKATKK